MWTAKTLVSTRTVGKVCGSSLNRSHVSFEKSKNRLLPQSSNWTKDSHGPPVLTTERRSAICKRALIVFMASRNTAHWTVATFHSSPARCPYPTMLDTKERDQLRLARNEAHVLSSSLHQLSRAQGCKVDCGGDYPNPMCPGTTDRMELTR